jgi:glycosyltransferase involved in cell wall biosynthesis
VTIRALDVEGSFRGPFGYDRHARAFVRALHRRGIAIHLFDFGDGPDRPALTPWQDPWFELFRRPVPSRVLLQFRMPHLVQAECEKIVVNFTMFEASRIPQHWVQQSRVVPLTVLTTESSRRAWIESGAPEDRIRLCPLGVDPLAFGGAVDPLPLRLPTGVPISSYRVRFLNVSAISPRKNLAGLMRAWLRATNRDDDAVLILKLTAYGPGLLTYVRREV